MKGKVYKRGSHLNESWFITFHRDDKLYRAYINRDVLNPLNIKIITKYNLSRERTYYYGHQNSEYLVGKFHGKDSCERFKDICCKIIDEHIASQYGLDSEKYQQAEIAFNKIL